MHIHSKKRHRLVARCQFYRLVATCKQVASTLSISSNCNKSVKIRLVATCHLQACYNLLKLSTCNKSVVELCTGAGVAEPELQYILLDPEPEPEPELENSNKNSGRQNYEKLILMKIAVLPEFLRSVT